MIYVALGANVPSLVGPSAVTLRKAIEALPVYGIRVVEISPFYLTPAWPNPSDPAFVNAVVEVRSKLGPSELLRALLSIEKSFGRVRKDKWEPRCLDLDLVDYGGLVSDDAQLMLPHPRAHERNFVLKPLSVIAPHWRHPDTGERIADLLKMIGEAGVSELEGS